MLGFVRFSAHPYPHQVGGFAVDREQRAKGFKSLMDMD
jgi:hypothetical protein